MDAPSIYPVASLHLPGSSPTRQSAGIQGRVAGIVSRLADPGAAGAVHFSEGDRRLLQCLPSLDGRRQIPSSLGRVQPERRPPQPRQWIGVGSGDTRPGLLLWLPVSGGPVFPSRRRHRRCGSQQLPQQRYFLVRRRTVLARSTTGQCPLPYRTAALANRLRVRACAFRSSGMLAVVIGLLRAPYSFPNRIIFSPILPTDVKCPLIRHRNCPP